MRLLPVLFAVLLTACGSGGGSPGASGGTPVQTPVTPAPPARGSLVGSGASSTGIYPAAALGLLLNSAQPGITAITGEPKCGISSYSLRYNSVGSNGESMEASTAIYQPTGSDPACTGARPLLLYAHGTSTDKAYDMSKLTSNTEARLVAAMYAAQGFLVVAPNYAGYAGSNLPYHPYLDAEQQANDMVDALRAARKVFAAIGTSASNKLFISGYSQGGHVAVATQRAMQTRFASEFTASGVAGMSGPYALAQMGDAIFNGMPTNGAATFLPLVINAGQRANAAIYANASDVFEAPYAATIDNLLPSASGLEELVAFNKLPAQALFAKDSLPQAAGYGSFFGAGNLVKTSYRSSYLADLQAHPCSVKPGDGPNCAPLNNLRRHLVKNDLRSYTPNVPMMLCGGESDPTVPYSNTQALGAYVAAGGVPASGLTILNVDDVPGLGSDYKTARSGFAAAKLALRLDALKSGKSPEEAVNTNYHAGLVAPFCMLAARDFLQALVLR